MDGEKMQTFGNDVLRRIRSFVFGKRKENHRNDSCTTCIPCGNIKLLTLTDTKTKSGNQGDNNQQQKKDKEEEQQHRQQQQQQQQQQKKDEEQQQEQQQEEGNEKKGKTEVKIPFSLFVKCAKNCLSTKQSRQQLYRESYTYFWHFLFGKAAAKARMAEEENYYEFYADFDEEFY